MALHLGRAFERGLRRAATGTGVVLMVLTFVYTAVFSGSINTVFLALLPPNVRGQAQIGFTLPLSMPAAAVLAVVALLFGMAVVIAMTRAFTRAPGEGGLAADLFTRRIGRAVVSSVGANVVVTVAVSIGFVLLVVPGLFLAVSFSFVVFAIGVEDARAIPALRRSWALARGNRWRLFLIVLVVGVVTGLAGSVGTVLSLANQSAGQLIGLALASVLATLGYGVVADAFVQAREATDAAEG